MPRPIRIEYENAFYHVMNRGRARNDIFFKDIHYLTFLKIIKESYERFGLIIHAYCLMPNHYHLLIQTPKANFSRAMRHINSVYTQRFNKIQKIDGPLFRGRYKSIVVDEEAYLLELTKYIHRNPIEVKNKSNALVSNIRDYKWSSYRSYLNLSKVPEWLDKERTLSMFKGGNEFDDIKEYELFVEVGRNEEVGQLMKEKNSRIIIGRENFKKELKDNVLDDQRKQNQVQNEINSDVPIEKIINEVAKAFNVTPESIMNKQQGKAKSNQARKMSIYMIQKYKDYHLRQMAELFGFNGVNSVACAISKAKKSLDIVMCRRIEEALKFNG